MANHRRARLTALCWSAAWLCSCIQTPIPDEPPHPAPDVPLAKIMVSSSGSGSTVETRREDVREVLFGREVRDPYRWLEADDAEVEEWTRAQNALTESALSQLSVRESLQQRIEELLAVGMVSRPHVARRGPGEFRYFHSRRDGRQDQPVLYARDTVAGPDRVVFDPNRENAKGTLSLDWYYPSRDGVLVAFGTSEDGSESSTLRIRNVETGALLDEAIERTRHSSVAWKPDRSGFYYSRYPRPGTVPPEEETYHRKIFEHRLGDDPKDDTLVFGNELEMTDFPSCQLSPNGRWLVITVSQGWSKSELYLADTRKAPLSFQKLTTGLNQLYGPIVRDDAVFVYSNEGASRYQVFALDPRKPERQSWRTVIAEHDTDVLDDVAAVGDRLLVAYLHEGAARLEQRSTNGKSLGAVALPTVGTSNGFTGHHAGEEAFFDFDSFSHAPSIHRLDFRTDDATQWASVVSPFDEDAFDVTRNEATSKDGTRIPYLTVRAKGRQTDGPAPTVLYGYGGFNISLKPRYSPVTAALIERGVTYVQANLRGGGELGEDWHRAGQLDDKERVFEDFEAVAEQLVTSGVTTRDELAIWGRSNGGLLVTAAITRRPDLFRAAVAGVPLTDMARYHLFELGKLWIPEYGSPDVPEQLAWLLAYSPYHHVVDDTPYPAVLLTTAAHDTRVHPMHARKMTAALQHASSSGRPVLLRAELEAGHGAGKPVRKVAAEYADTHAFLLWQLGIVSNNNGVAAPPESE